MARIVFMTDLSESYARRLVVGASRYVLSKGEAWSLFRIPWVMFGERDWEAMLSYVEKMDVDAVIGQFEDIDMVRQLKQRGIIVVAQDYKRILPGVSRISGEYYESGAMAVRYFLEKGFTSFGFFSTPRYFWADERRKGFEETLFLLKPDCSFSCLSLPERNVWIYDIDLIQDWLLSLPKPAAIMACDDNSAYQLIEVCSHIAKKLGDKASVRVPEDIAILGVDNDESVCNLSTPTLTSIEQEAEKGGFEAAAYIDRLLKSGEPESSPQEIVVHASKIVTRGSTDIFVNEDPHISRALHFIERSMNQPLSVSEVVAQVPLSRRLLETRFKDATGTSIYKYILNAKIERLCRLLSEGWNVSQAAYELGFSDVKNLSRVFRRIKGMSPSEYRREAQSEE